MAILLMEFGLLSMGGDYIIQRIPVPQRSNEVNLFGGPQSYPALRNLRTSQKLPDGRMVYLAAMRDINDGAQRGRRGPG